MSHDRGGMMKRPTLEWLPVGRTVSMRPAGKWWDAVRVPLSVGLDALGRLGIATGAVIEDPGAALLYWFVPPGDAARWILPSDGPIRVLGDTAHVAVPGPQRTSGPHWRVPPTRVRALTDPDALRDALHAAIDDRGIRARQ